VKKYQRNQSGHNFRLKLWLRHSLNNLIFLFVSGVRLVELVYVSRKRKMCLAPLLQVLSELIQ